jgi:hypothetical protein
LSIELLDAYLPHCVLDAARAGGQAAEQALTEARLVRS